jgi:hypothetical protein
LPIAVSLVEIIPARAELGSGIGLKLFGLIAEWVFSGSRRNSVRNHPGIAFMFVGFPNRHGNRVCVYIQTNKAYFRRLSYAALRRWISPLRGVTRATANRRLVAHYD